MANNNNTPTTFHPFEVQNCSANIYIEKYIDIDNQRFVQELQEVVGGSKVVNNISMVCELREALYIEEQNINDQNRITHQLLKINHDIVSRIVELIERFINNLPICISSDLDTNEDMNIIEPEDTCYTRCFTRILNGFTILFNVNHRMLIQLIEKNSSERNGLATAQCEEYYKAILHAIEQNSICQNYPIVLVTAHRSYRRLRKVIEIENNVPVEQGVRRNYQRPSILVPMIEFTFTLWFIMIIGIMIFGAFLFAHDDKIIMSMSIGFIVLSIFVLLK